MKNEFTYVELSDEQLELVVGGDGGSTAALISQVAFAANVGGSFATNQQNANATNQAAVGSGASNWNATWQTNFNSHP
jgi:hypothetical protein